MTLKRFPMSITALILMLNQLSPALQGKDPGNTATPTIAITITAANSAKIGLPMLVRVIVTNTSGHDIVVPVMSLEGLRNHLHMEIRDSAGKALLPRKTSTANNSNTMVSPKIEDIPFGGQRSFFLAPGTSNAFAMDLSQAYDLSQPDKYRIQAQYFDKSDRVWIKSNFIMITIAN